MSHEKSEHDRAALEVIDLLLRHRWRFIAPMFVVAMLVLIASLGLPKKYHTSGIFERQQDAVLSDMSRGGASRTYQNVAETQLKALADEPAVDRLLQQIEPELRQLNIVQDDSQLENIRRDILQRVIIRQELTSADLKRIKVEYTANDPKLVSMVVNGLIDNYIDKARSDMHQQLADSRTFFLAELRQCQRDIETTEDALLRFELENADLMPENPNSMQAQSLRLEEDLDDLKRQRDSLVMRKAALQKTIDGEPGTVPSLRKERNPELARLEQQLAAARNKLDENLNVFKMRSAHPDVQNLNRQIESLDKQIAETEEEVVTGREIVKNPKVDELELRLTSVESDIETVEHNITTTEARLAEMSKRMPDVLPVRTEAKRLEREADQARRQVGFWEDKLQRVELAMTAEDGDRGLRLAFIRPAPIPRRPVSPKLSQILMAAVLFGGAVGSLSVFLAHRSDDSFSSGHRLASETGIPLLGNISELVTRRYSRIRRTRRMILYPMNAAAMLVVLGAAVSLVYFNLEHSDKMAFVQKAAATYQANAPQQPEFIQDEVVNPSSPDSAMSAVPSFPYDATTAE